MKNPPFLLFLHHLPAQLLSNSGSDDPLEGVELPELPAPQSGENAPGEAAGSAAGAADAGGERKGKILGSTIG
jgi:hypothetical protein